MNSSLNSPTFSSSPNPSKAPKTSLRYKENVATLFQKLNTLQQASETLKSHTQSKLVREFSQKEEKVHNSETVKADQFEVILRSVNTIEKQLEKQHNDEERMRRSVGAMVEGAKRQLHNSFDRLEKERIQSQNALQHCI